MAIQDIRKSGRGVEDFAIQNNDNKKAIDRFIPRELVYDASGIN